MLNKPSAQRDQKGSLTITISEDAVKHIKEFGKLEGKKDTNLRVGVKGGGCSGLTYVLELAESAKDNEKVITENGLELYVDKKSYIFCPWFKCHSSKDVLCTLGFIFLTNPADALDMSYPSGPIKFCIFPDLKSL